MKNNQQTTAQDKTKSYSEKEILIFKGVLALAVTHKNMYSVTVQDIAEAAGVGKGTIYDYFSSKEEIMVKTILYSVSLANKKTTELVENLATFKQKMLAVYDMVVESVDNKLSAFNLTMSIGGISELCTLAKDHEEDIKRANYESQKIFKNILLTGVTEKVILPTTDLDYIRMAINSNIMAVGKEVMECKETADIEKIKGNGYKLLIKTLN